MILTFASLAFAFLYFSSYEENKGYEQRLLKVKSKGQNALLITMTMAKGTS